MSRSSEILTATGSTERLVGRVLCKKWRLIRVLGAGGMATVFEAVHRNGKRVAIKILHVERALNPQVKNRFLREGYVANRIQHSGAVSVLDDDTDEDGTAFLVMELLIGETLEQRIERSGGKLTLPEGLAVTYHVLDVLAAAHRLGIVHRDIKPTNLFITSEGALKVLDFGIARVTDLNEIVAESTGTGVTLGTPAFMAPEQARGRPDLIDARSDVWTVGALLFLLSSGRLVHEGGTSNEIMIARASVPPPPLRTVAPDVPSSVADLVDRALRLNPSDRFDDAAAMRSSLVEAWQSAGLDGSPGEHRLALPLSHADTLPDPSSSQPSVTACSVTEFDFEPRPSLSSEASSPGGSAASVARDGSSAKKRGLRKPGVLVFAAPLALSVLAAGAYWGARKSASLGSDSIGQAPVESVGAHPSGAGRSAELLPPPSPAPGEPSSRASLGEVAQVAQTPDAGSSPAQSRHSAAARRHSTAKKPVPGAALEPTPVDPMDRRE